MSSHRCLQNIWLAACLTPQGEVVTLRKALCEKGTDPSFRVVQDPSSLAH